jgi:hypothetical protein
MAPYPYEYGITLFKKKFSNVVYDFWLENEGKYGVNSIDRGVEVSVLTESKKVYFRFKYPNYILFLPYIFVVCFEYGDKENSFMKVKAGYATFFLPILYILLEVLIFKHIEIIQIFLMLYFVYDYKRLKDNIVWFCSRDR